MARSDRLIELYYAALSRPVEERDRFLTDACAGDEDLRIELDGLLAQHVSRSGPLDGVAFAVAASLWTADATVLRAGDRVGIYEITAPLGAGGMGQVYRALDPVLGRDVAIKVLSPFVTADPAHLARIEREARVLASLNHPNIASIYRLELAGSVPALVLELVTGETLAARIARARLTLVESLAIAAQLCDALEAAHERGIVHRDLKPANVMITPAGVVKVLDFGVARVLPTEGPDLASHGQRATGGTIVGTPAYMSPEQARGHTVDQRTDIWAFGCVLFEMLAGRPAFAAATPSDTLVAVLEAEPAWHALPEDLALAIRRLLARCLRKNARERLRDIGDARLEIDEARSTAHGAAAPERSAHTRIGWWWRAAMLVPALVAAGAAAAWILGRTDPAPAVTRSVIALQPFDRSSSADVSGRSPAVRFEQTAVALSPDGRTLVWQGRTNDGVRLYRRSLDGLETTPIEGTEGADTPFFSPDGKWLGFRADGELRRVALTGGPPTTIAVIPIRVGPTGRVNALARIFGATWAEGDRIVFATGGADGNRLWVVPGQGGKPQVVAGPAADEHAYRLPHALPGGDSVLFTIVRTVTWWDDASIAVRSLSTGEQKILIDGGSDARYVPSGHLVFVRQGTLMAAGFDVRRLEVTSRPVALIKNVMHAVNAGSLTSDTGAGQFATAGGTLAYVTGGIIPQPRKSLVWIDRNGGVEKLPLAVDAYYMPRLAPDGSRMAVFTSESGVPRVWSVDLRHGTRFPVTTVQERGTNNLWTGDGARIVFNKSPELDVYWKSADGTGPSEPLYESDYPAWASSWHPDRKTLAVVENSPATGEDILLVDITKPGQPPIRFAGTGVREFYPEFSPDGKSLAYASNDSDLAQVFVAPFPGPGRRVQISVDGGTAPTWRADSRELYFMTPPLTADGRLNREPGAIGRRLMAATFDEDGRPVGKPSVLFEETPSRRFENDTPVRGYDVTPDGKKFLMVQPLGRLPEPAPQLVLVQNWVQELQRLVPAQ